VNLIVMEHQHQLIVLLALLQKQKEYLLPLFVLLMEE
jgi:hypothetical protein